MKMTWRELIKKLRRLTPEQLDTDATIWDGTIDEFYQIQKLGITSENDVLDENHPYLAYGLREEEKLPEDFAEKPENPLASEYQQAARRQWSRSDSSIEFDDNPAVSIMPEGNGAYVQAWVWVDAKEVKKP